MTVLDIVDSCAYGTMSRNSKAYDQKFKENVINYVLEHPEEKYTALGNKFGVHPTTIAGWMKQYRSMIIKLSLEAVVIMQVMKLKKSPN